MQGLEELIYSVLKDDVVLSAKMADYNGQPAIFELNAPADTDPGWSEIQYPRVVYVIDKSENPERKVNGTLAIDIAITNTAAEGPETIEARVRELLSNAFYEPSGEPPAALVWNQTNPFEADDETIGVTMIFDMIAFPEQRTHSPDVILALESWVKAKITGAQLVNRTPVAPYHWKPTGATPAVYWRSVNIRTDQITNAVVWLNMTINGHVFAPTPTERLPIIRKIVETLALDAYIYLADGSPATIQTVAADSNRDPHRDGQISLTVRFGILKPEASAIILNYADFGSIGGA